MKTILKMIIIYIILFLVSYSIMSMIRINNDPIGKRLIEIWISERGNPSSYSIDINSPIMTYIQSIALSLFLFVIAATVVKMEWRTGVAILAVAAIIFLSIVTPQSLVHNAIEWNLILFLIGSMSFAGILREMGVFRYLSIKILSISKDNVLILITLIGILALVLSAVIGEVTSIVYVALLVLEIGSILRIDVEPLIIFSVLATNTGSVALPIGNPIGVYLLFTTNMSISRFIRYALPLSLLDFLVLLSSALIVMRKYVSDIRNKLLNQQRIIKTYITHYEVEFGNSKKRKSILYGLTLLITFVVLVSLNDYIASFLSTISEQPIDPHSLLAFIPYIFIALCIAGIPLEEISRHIEKSVEWSSLMFFICLFILSYSLTHTGVMAKLAYVFASIGNQALLLPLMLISSAFLSSVLDNLSVIVTFTPIAQLLNSLGRTGFLIYFALLFGGVFGGNYTPIGSTANIVAVSMAEKRRIRIKWGSWLRIALITTTLQILVAMLWLYISSFL